MRVALGEGLRPPTLSAAFGRSLLRHFVLLIAPVPLMAAAGLPAGEFEHAQCIECHGERSPEVHSYTTSKHGVIVRLASGPPGRAPDCTGCHTSEAHAPAEAKVAPQPCGQCHSPRFVRTLDDNGARSIEIGELKLREAQALLERAHEGFPPSLLIDMQRHYERMQQHFRNLRLGVAHQSPDYQWWHGHPALDGDLLRIKGAYDRLARQKALAETVGKGR